MNRYDVVIIGGSLAGATCARELVRRGINAVAFERDRFPRRKVCGGFLSPGGVERLDRLDLLEDVRRAGATLITSARVRSGNVEVVMPFPKPGLGISRFKLDEIVARTPHVLQGTAVTRVEKTSKGFSVAASFGKVECGAVIDASGKLSRFTRRRPSGQFGVQFDEPVDRGSVLDFWFSEQGYGGAVSIEEGRSNHCYLLSKDRLAPYTDRSDCLVTGPLAYERKAGDYIAIGDAAGMVDPFCGEGMRHALDCGIVAAEVVAQGIRAGKSYGQMRADYEERWARAWRGKRLLGAAIRQVTGRPRLFRAGLRHFSGWILERIWD